jgi:hypothetical protein
MWGSGAALRMDDSLQRDSALYVDIHQAWYNHQDQRFRVALLLPPTDTPGFQPVPPI